MSNNGRYPPRNVGARPSYPPRLPATNSNPRPYVSPLTATNCNNNAPVQPTAAPSHGGDVLLSFTCSSAMTPDSVGFHTSPCEGVWADEVDKIERRKESKKRGGGGAPQVQQVTIAATQAPVVTTTATSITNAEQSGRGPLSSAEVPAASRVPPPRSREISPPPAPAPGGKKAEHWDDSPLEARCEYSAFYKPYHKCSPPKARPCGAKKGCGAPTPPLSDCSEDEGTDNHSDNAGAGAATGGGAWTAPLQQSISLEAPSITPSSGAGTGTTLTHTIHANHDDAAQQQQDSSMINEAPASLGGISTPPPTNVDVERDAAMVPPSIHGEIRASATATAGGKFETGDEGISETPFSNKFDFANNPAVGGSDNLHDGGEADGVVGDDGAPQGPVDPEAEARLTDRIYNYMANPTVNKFKGSLPVERVQNYARSQEPDLYANVVGFGHNCWRRFVNRHTNTFVLFLAENGKGRMRLHIHTAWKNGDKEEQAARGTFEHHLIQCLCAHLEQQRNHRCTVDEFSNAYPGLPQNVERKEAGEPEHELPMRGDLVRFIRRHSALFFYNNNTFVITLRDLGAGAGSNPQTNSPPQHYHNQPRGRNNRFNNNNFHDEGFGRGDRNGYHGGRGGGGGYGQHQQNYYPAPARDFRAGPSAPADFSRFRSGGGQHEDQNTNKSNGNGGCNPRFQSPPPPRNPPRKDDDDDEFYGRFGNL